MHTSLSTYLHPCTKKTFSFCPPPTQCPCFLANWCPSVKGALINKYCVFWCAVLPKLKMESCTFGFVMLNCSLGQLKRFQLWQQLVLCKDTCFIVNPLQWSVCHMVGSDTVIPIRVETISLNSSRYVSTWRCTLPTRNLLLIRHRVPAVWKECTWELSAFSFLFLPCICDHMQALNVKHIPSSYTQHTMLKVCIKQWQYCLGPLGMSVRCPYRPGPDGGHQTVHCHKSC